VLPWRRFGSQSGSAGRASSGCTAAALASVEAPCSDLGYRIVPGRSTSSIFG